jgi:hypothetical protein
VFAQKKGAGRVTGSARADNSFGDECLLDTPRDLIPQLNDARDRLDEEVDLMQRALDLREQLTWGLDLEILRDGVADWRREVEQRKRRARP